MKFKVGSKVVVKNVYSGGNFDDGDIVTIVRIGDEDGFDPNCYGAISPHDGLLWYLNEDEVAPATNADRIRAMTDEEMAWELMLWRCEAVARHHGISSEYPDTQQTILKWLHKPVEDDDHA